MLGGHSMKSAEVANRSANREEELFSRFSMHNMIFTKRQNVLCPLIRTLLSTGKHMGANLQEKWRARFKAPVFFSPITNAQLLTWVPNYVKRRT